MEELTHALQPLDQTSSGDVFDTHERVIGSPNTPALQKPHAVAPTKPTPDGQALNDTLVDDRGTGGFFNNLPARVSAADDLVGWHEAEIHQQELEAAQRREMLLLERRRLLMSRERENRVSVQSIEDGILHEFGCTGTGAAEDDDTASNYDDVKLVSRQADSEADSVLREAMGCCAPRDAQSVSGRLIGSIGGYDYHREQALVNAPPVPHDSPPEWARVRAEGWSSTRRRRKGSNNKPQHHGVQATNSDQYIDPFSSVSAPSLKLSQRLQHMQNKPHEEHEGGNRSGDERYLELLRMSCADGWLDASEAAQLESARARHCISLHRHYELLALITGNGSYGNRAGIDEYMELLEMALADGWLSWGEDQRLAEARLRYKISPAEHYAMMAEVVEGKQRLQHSGEQGREEDLNMADRQGGGSADFFPPPRRTARERSGSGHAVPPDASKPAQSHSRSASWLERHEQRSRTAGPTTGVEGLVSPSKPSAHSQYVIHSIDGEPSRAHNAQGYVIHSIDSPLPTRASGEDPFAEVPATNQGLEWTLVGPDTSIRPKAPSGFRSARRVAGARSVSLPPRAQTESRAEHFRSNHEHEQNWGKEWGQEWRQQQQQHNWEADSSSQRSPSRSPPRQHRQQPSPPRLVEQREELRAASPTSRPSIMTGMPGKWGEKDATRQIDPKLEALQQKRRELEELKHQRLLQKRRFLEHELEGLPHQRELAAAQGARTESQVSTVGEKTTEEDAEKSTQKRKTIMQQDNVPDRKDLLRQNKLQRQWERDNYAGSTSNQEFVALTEDWADAQEDKQRQFECELEETIQDEEVQRPRMINGGPFDGIWASLDARKQRDGYMSIRGLAVTWDTGLQTSLEIHSDGSIGHCSATAGWVALEKIGIEDISTLRFVGPTMTTGRTCITWIKLGNGPPGSDCDAWAEALRSAVIAATAIMPSECLVHSL
jgi:hypothetical protein